jgi:hypothetical protein
VYYVIKGRYKTKNKTMKIIKRLTSADLERNSIEDAIKKTRATGRRKSPLALFEISKAIYSGLEKDKVAIEVLIKHLQRSVKNNE